MKGIDSVSDRLFGIDLFGLGGPARNSVKSCGEATCTNGCLTALHLQRLLGSDALTGY
jgi:hypothetical protein